MLMCVCGVALFVLRTSWFWPSLGVCFRFLPLWSHRRLMPILSFVGRASCLSLCRVPFFYVERHSHRHVLTPLPCCLVPVLPKNLRLPGMWSPYCSFRLHHLALPCACSRCMPKGVRPRSSAYCHPHDTISLSCLRRLSPGLQFPLATSPLVSFGDSFANRLSALACHTLRVVLLLR